LVAAYSPHSATFGDRNTLPALKISTSGGTPPSAESVPSGDLCPRASEKKRFNRAYLACEVSVVSGVEQGCWQGLHFVHGAVPREKQRCSFSLGLVVSVHMLVARYFWFGGPWCSFALESLRVGRDLWPLPSQQSSRLRSLCRRAFARDMHDRPSICRRHVALRQKLFFFEFSAHPMLTVWEQGRSGDFFRPG
jgi:hypothetical protein